MDGFWSYLMYLQLVHYQIQNARLHPEFSIFEGGGGVIILYIHAFINYDIWRQITVYLTTMQVIKQFKKIWKETN